MSTWKKIAIGAGVAILLLSIASFGVYQSRKNVATVQTGKAQRLDLASVVSASGEIKTKTYVNIGAKLAITGGHGCTGCGKAGL